MMARVFLALAALGGLSSVILGAFGAHALKTRMPAELLTTYQTGVQYQFYHSLALLAIGILLLRTQHDIALNLAGMFFVLGILLFSGSLYGLTLMQWKWLGPVTPVGGLVLIAGWCSLFIAVIRTH